MESSYKNLLLTVFVFLIWVTIFFVVRPILYPAPYIDFKVTVYDSVTGMPIEGVTIDRYWNERHSVGIMSVKTEFYALSNSVVTNKDGKVEMLSGHTPNGVTVNAAFFAYKSGYKYKKVFTSDSKGVQVYYVELERLPGSKKIRNDAIKELEAEFEGRPMSKTLKSLIDEDKRLIEKLPERSNGLEPSYLTMSLVARQALSWNNGVNFNNTPYEYVIKNKQVISFVVSESGKFVLENHCCFVEVNAKGVYLSSVLKNKSTIEADKKDIIMGHLHQMAQKTRRHISESLDYYTTDGNVYVAEHEHVAVFDKSMKLVYEYAMKNNQILVGMFTDENGELLLLAENRDNAYKIREKQSDLKTTFYRFSKAGNALIEREFTFTNSWGKDYYITIRAVLDKTGNLFVIFENIIYKYNEKFEEVDRFEVDFSDFGEIGVDGVALDENNQIFYAYNTVKGFIMKYDLKNRKLVN